MTGVPLLDSDACFDYCFSKVEQFTDDDGLDLCQWPSGIKQCCVIADKETDHGEGETLIRCINGRAKAILDQCEVL